MKFCQIGRNTFRKDFSTDPMKYLVYSKKFNRSYVHVSFHSSVEVLSILGAEVGDIRRLVACRPKIGHYWLRLGTYRRQERRLSESIVAGSKQTWFVRCRLSVTMENWDGSGITKLLLYLYCCTCVDNPGSVLCQTGQNQYLSIEIETFTKRYFIANNSIKH